MNPWEMPANWDGNGPPAMATATSTGGNGSVLWISPQSNTIAPLAVTGGTYQFGNHPIGAVDVQGGSAVVTEDRPSLVEPSYMEPAFWPQGAPWSADARLLWVMGVLLVVVSAVSTVSVVLL